MPLGNMMARAWRTYQTIGLGLSPGTPPAGPVGGFGELEDNPWILYWFLSIRAPMLLEVVDLHIDRRLQEIAERAGQR